RIMPVSARRSGGSSRTRSQNAVDRGEPSSEGPLPFDAFRNRLHMVFVRLDLPPARSPIPAAAVSLANLLEAAGQLLKLHHPCQPPRVGVKPIQAIDRPSSG